jgi:erythromycin esterase-like protein
MQASRNSESNLEDRIAKQAHVLESLPKDFDPLIEAIGESRIVLIGEASHGTHEFYHQRAQITKRLIREKNFHGVVVEADWPDAARVNRYVMGRSEDADATESLSGFQRFPQWMWRNADVLDFVGWLREYNDGRRMSEQKCGFYGMDLYSMHASMAAVLKYLDEVDPAAAGRARYRYSCFEHFGEEPQAYGYAASFDLDASCRQHVIQQLVEMQQNASRYAGRDGIEAEDEYFFAEQNARLVKDAEQYYRSMFEGHVSSWNLRDRHMAQTLEELMKHLDRRVGKTKLVVWAHNSHLGDARATDVAQQGELNVGQLARERWAEECFNIGFSTYTGSVTAADDWDGPAKRKTVNPGLPDSYETLFHDVQILQFLLIVRGAADAIEELHEPRLQRAIGVIYRPQSERLSHYYHARLAEQFDAMIHIDETRAVEPLERTPAEVGLRIEEETYPSGV